MCDKGVLMQENRTSKIKRLRDELKGVRAAIKRLVEGGLQSATSGGGGATDSYTNLSLTELRELEQQLVRRINRVLNGGRAPIIIEQPYFV